MGDPFGFLNEFGGIGGGVSNIIPTLLSQGFAKKLQLVCFEDVAFVNKGVKLTNENGGKVVPPPIIKSGGTSNLSKVITNPEDEPPNDRITYQVGLDDGKCQVQTVEEQTLEELMISSLFKPMII